jgi:hypothetical protein
MSGWELQLFFREFGLLRLSPVDGERGRVVGVCDVLEYDPVSVRGQAHLSRLRFGVLPVQRGVL